MYNKIKDLKNALDMVKNIQQNPELLNGIDDVFNNMGIDKNMFENKLSDTLKHKFTLKYTKINGDAIVPKYAYDSDSGFDLHSTEEVTLLPFERKLIPTGLSFDIPEGFEIQVRTKSGLALKQGLIVLNSPGTVDQGYTGEVKVILMNMNNTSTTISKGQKIAQGVLCPVMSGSRVTLHEVVELNNKERGDNGFGSTGI